MTTDQLYSEIRKKGSMLCVGLDTDYAKIPECVKEGRSVAEAVLEFNRRIIDATAPYCVAFKPNLAFYEYLGKDGLEVLEKTVAHIRDNHPGEFIIADAKRGDIGNTAKMYAKSLFETFDFDAVTLSPYMGSETVTPFLDYPGRYAIVVALSSNPTSYDFQNALNGDKPLYRSVMEKMMEISSPENMMFVVGATKADKFKEIRTFCPDNFLLVPGVGAQGGSAEEVIAGGSNSKGGLLINSSRGVIYASTGDDFESAAAKVASQTAHVVL
ncbi:MAG: orotidine-5'-phosphate decarboxylase [Bacteroidales bacterium]|nr:orotidine-5'-phosphate decarboxylase [Bacteroidales bacterium]